MTKLVNVTQTLLVRFLMISDMLNKRPHILRARSKGRLVALLHQNTLTMLYGMSVVPSAILESGTYNLEVEGVIPKQIYTCSRSLTSRMGLNTKHTIRAYVQ